MDAVFFDIDDTLYDQALPFARAVRSVVGDIPGVSADELYQASRAHSGEVFGAYGRGERPTEEAYVRRMCETLADFGRNITVDQARAIQRLYSLADAGTLSLSETMADVLTWCKLHAKRGVGLITNGAFERQMGKVRVLGLNRFVEDSHVFVSEAWGVAKPDARIFEIACEHVGVRPENSLYVGDAYDIDVLGAHDAGMPVIWFNRRGHTILVGLSERAPRWTVESEHELLEIIKRLV